LDRKTLNIKDFTFEELSEFLKNLGVPSYRADQIFGWLYQKNVEQWDDMTNLPVILRQKLAEHNVALGCLAPLEKDIALDGTIKYLFEMTDGQTVESVYLPDDDRHTVCFSTQVGCAMGCSFCATGQIGFHRNLTAGEIVDQPLGISRMTGAAITNLVAMGQGEPFYNYDELMKAIRILNDPKGLGLGARHITISTCGVIPGMLKLSEEMIQVNLAISLHAADDDLRNRLMPVNRKYPIPELMDACKTYINRTGRRITFEYTLIQDVNDRKTDLANLIRLLRGMLCHVNLIPFNQVPGSKYSRSDNQQVELFLTELNRAHIETTVRKERGSSLTAACGQLQGKRFN
jgi:23S rRNA (adenine2503-C2)-methyltransferase